MHTVLVYVFALECGDNPSLGLFDWVVWHEPILLSLRSQSKQTIGSLTDVLLSYPPCLDPFNKFDETNLVFGDVSSSMKLNLILKTSLQTCCLLQLPSLYFTFSNLLSSALIYPPPHLSLFSMPLRHVWLTHCSFPTIPCQCIRIQLPQDCNFSLSTRWCYNTAEHGPTLF